MEVRWLLPYADMITLMLALFVMLYAASNQNNARMAQLANSVNKAFNGKKPTVGQSTSDTQTNVPKDSPGNHLLESGVTLKQLREAAAHAKERQAEDERLKRLQWRIENFARRRNMSNRITAVIDERGLVVRILSDKVLFDLGEAEIRPQAEPILRGIQRILRTELNPIRVEGHTDNLPIRTAAFPSNWELSGDRAASVVRLFVRNGTNPARLSAAGYGEHRPLRSNASSFGRSRNRRVEIVVLRQTGLSPLAGG